MSKLDIMKERYDQTIIPAELSLRIQQEIQNSRKQQEEIRGGGRSRRFKKVIRSVEAAAAIVCILFTIALNMSPVFAKEAGQLPVIGGLVRILTFRSYETQKDDIAVSVEIPTIEMITEDTGITVDGIIQEILAFTAEEGGFTGISEAAKFYINENNCPVIVFGKYEIAPGSSGESEFEIAGGN